MSHSLTHHGFSVSLDLMVLNVLNVKPSVRLLLCCFACLPQHVNTVDRSTVDQFGDRIMLEILPRDHWRTRHDSIKMAFYSLCTCKCRGLGALTRMERGRKRQALLPDFRVELPCPNDWTNIQLAELKVISCSKSSYIPALPRSEERGTDKRTQQLPGDYRRKAEISGYFAGPRDNKQWLLIQD